LVLATSKGPRNFALNANLRKLASTSRESQHGEVAIHLGKSIGSHPHAESLQTRHLGLPLLLRLLHLPCLFQSTFQDLRKSTLHHTRLSRAGKRQLGFHHAIRSVRLRIRPGTEMAEFRCNKRHHVQFRPPETPDKTGRAERSGERSCR
jgi:hypothetical protein